MSGNLHTFELLKKLCKERKKQIYEIAQEYMSVSSDISVEEVRAFSLRSLNAMRDAVKCGLASNESSFSGMCGNDCDKVQRTFYDKPPMFGPVFANIIKYALATSEENIRMGRIVACPTAGSCGILPSVILGVSEYYKFTEEEQLNALIAAGEIGRVISQKLSLAGAVAGCQAECGVASAMAAGALCQLRGGNINQILNAAALALKNILGLTCDPVAGLVEVPCVKRNPFMAIHAVTACELALANVESVIPIDEVVDAMAQIGSLMSPMLKESSQAGLATTKTAQKISSKIFK